MPFGPYEDFQDCVDQNQDKDNPEAFCAWLKQRTEGSVSKGGLKLQIVREPMFADENGDGLDDVTGEPVEEVVIGEIPAENTDAIG